MGIVFILAVPANPAMAHAVVQRTGMVLQLLDRVALADVSFAENVRLHTALPVDGFLVPVP